MPHSLCFGSDGSQGRMHGLIQDVEAGYVRRIAFVMPVGATWPVALYELALPAERAFDQCQTCEITLLTGEPAPLAIFGAATARATRPTAASRHHPADLGRRRGSGTWASRDRPRCGAADRRPHHHHRSRSCSRAYC
jgi:hypothetical protein